MAQKEKVLSTFDEFEFLDSNSWDIHYQKREESSPPDEWYVSWDDFSPSIMSVLGGLDVAKTKILVPACGDSKLSENLYSSGFKSITSIDYSSQLIKLMKEKHKDKVEMQWLAKDIMAPVQDPPNLIVRSYDVLIDKGCFDSLVVTAENSDVIAGLYLLQVKKLLADKGKYICLTRQYMDDTMELFCRRFWLGWKVTVQRVFKQKDDPEKAVMLVIERCSTRLLHDIAQVEKHPAVVKENKLRRRYMESAMSKDDFEVDIENHEAKSYSEVNYTPPQSDFLYRVIILTGDKGHNVNTVDILWVPEDHLLLDKNALTSSKHYWQLERFFSTLTKSSEMLFIVLSPKLHLMSDCTETKSKIISDLKPLLDIIGRNIQVGWLQMWDEKHDKGLKGIEYLPAPQSSNSADKKKRVAKKKHISKQKGRHNLEKGAVSSDVISQKLDPEVADEHGEDVIHGEDDYNNKLVAVSSDVISQKLDQEVADEHGEDVDLDAAKPCIVAVSDVEEEEKEVGILGHILKVPPLDFPNFYDGDDIIYYPTSFTIKSWLLGHQKKEDRWLCDYPRWNDILPSRCPNLLKRETMKIVQSVLIGVVDFHEMYGPHCHLSDLDNIVVTQSVSNHVGSKVIKFDAKLERSSQDTIDNEIELISKKEKDMTCVIKFLEKILEGGTKTSEMNFLLKLLFEYPYKSNNWKLLLVKHHPALWDSQERAEFFVKLYFHLNSNVHSNPRLRSALHLTPLFNLKKKQLGPEIPPDSIFGKVLNWPNKPGESSTSQPNKPGESSTSRLIQARTDLPTDGREVLRYIKVALQHFQENGGAGLDLRYVEAGLSEIFENFLLAIYSNMCRTKIFM
ncbi:hypothetical protein ACHQM5_028425 [Ranunculus cassubicifolius]